MNKVTHADMDSTRERHREVRQWESIHLYRYY